MESFGHKIIILSQPVPLTRRGVLYPRVRDFFLLNGKNELKILLTPETLFKGFRDGLLMVFQLSFCPKANFNFHCTSDLKCLLLVLLPLLAGFYPKQRSNHFQVFFH